MEPCRIRIEKLVHRGLGLGRSDGRVWLVPGTLPGDLVTATVARDRGGHVEGEMDALLEEGPGRVEPPCPVYGECGGCHLQHADHDTQVAMKSGVLRESLERAGVTEAPGPEVLTGEQWGWRDRAQFHVDGPKIGLFGRGSRRIVEIEQCAILAPVLSRLLPAIREAIGRAGTRGSWDLEVVSGAGDRIVAIATGEGGRMRPLADHLVRVPGIAGCLAGTKGKRGYRWTKRGDTTLAFETCDAAGTTVPLSADARCFSQANGRLNRTLVRKVLEYAGPTAGARVLELYSGAGNLTVPLALAGVELTAVESDRRSIDSARGNVRRATGGGARFVRSAAAPAVREAVRRSYSFDLVVADPPRPGLKGVTESLTRLGHNVTVMCSCEPATLARDLAELTADGWSIDRMALLDMFPQTYHMETVVRLER